VEAAANIPRGIRVLIADDHRLFSEALEAILTADGRVEVVGHAADGAEAVKLALELEPDVVVMDISMPVMDGFQATRQIRKQQPQASICSPVRTPGATWIAPARPAPRAM
jgi:DNA-binding NarL/FixJ family response regulator